MTTKRAKFGDVALNLNETIRSGAEHSLTRVVGLEHIDSGDPELRRWDELSSLPDGTSFTKVFRRGQVLFGKRRAYQRKVAVASFDGICSSDILVFAPRSKDLHPDFMLYVVQSDGFFAHALQTSSGSLSPRTRWQDLATFEFELPTTEEQQRIIEMMTAVDEHVEVLRSQLDVLQITRKSFLQNSFSDISKKWPTTSLDDLVVRRIVSLGRGNVISKQQIEAEPGTFPVYSSAQNNEGLIGTYGKFMFDEELITWSIDGGGHVFYRPRHKFSVTNIGGYLRILDSSKFLYLFLAAVLQKLHSLHEFDWQRKAHPSVIRNLYNKIPLVPLEEQQRIVDEVSKIDGLIQDTNSALVATQQLRSALLNKEIS
jgi:restriction endonuclease S subunit